MSVSKRAPPDTKQCRKVKNQSGKKRGKDSEKEI
jgi:hypothetical protein